MKKRFRPSAPASQPLIGRMIALETRYDVSTHVDWSLLAPRLPAMYGNATFAMLVSNTSMKAARATMTATNQGLNLGCQTSWSRARSVELIANTPSVRDSSPDEVGGPYFRQVQERFGRGCAERSLRSCLWHFQGAED